MGGRRGRTVSTFEGYYGTGDGSATGSIGAVANTVAEIDVVAKTGWVWSRASKT